MLPIHSLATSLQCVTGLALCAKHANVEYRVGPSLAKESRHITFDVQIIDADFHA